MELIYVFLFCLAIAAVLWMAGNIIDTLRDARQIKEVTRSDWYTWQMTHPHDDPWHDEDHRL